MKITKAGKPQYPRYGICHTCKVEFEFTNHDLIPSSWMSPERLQCPCCGRFNNPESFERTYRDSMIFRNQRKKFEELTKKKE